MSYDATLTKLQRLRAQRPRDALSPHEVTATVAQQSLHDAQVASLQREAAQLTKLLEERQAARTAARAELARLGERAQQLRHQLPSLRQRIVEAQDNLAIRRRDADHAVTLGERNLQAAERALAAAEAELAQLTGDAP